MVIKYTIDRKSLYDGEYENGVAEMVSGNIDDKIKLRTHLPVIYWLVKFIRRKDNDYDNKEAKEAE